MAKIKKGRKPYTSNQIAKVAIALNVRQNAGHGVIAAKLCEHFGWNLPKHSAFKKYFTELPEINGINPLKIAINRKKKPHITEKTVISVNGSDVQSKDFLSTYEWRKLRLQALMKYGSRCQCCGATPQSGAIMNVDHIKPRKTHPELALVLDNLQVLCSECNHGKGNWTDHDFRF